MQGLVKRAPDYLVTKELALGKTERRLLMLNTHPTSPLLAVEISLYKRTYGGSLDYAVSVIPKSEPPATTDMRVDRMNSMLRKTERQVTAQRTISEIEPANEFLANAPNSNFKGSRDSYTVYAGATLAQITHTLNALAQQDLLSIDTLEQLKRATGMLSPSLPDTTVWDKGINPKNKTPQKTPPAKDIKKESRGQYILTEATPSYGSSRQLVVVDEHKSERAAAIALIVQQISGSSLRYSLNLIPFRHPTDGLNTKADYTPFPKQGSIARFLVAHDSNYATGSYMLAKGQNIADIEKALKEQVAKQAVTEEMAGIVKSALSRLRSDPTITALDNGIPEPRAAVSIG